MDFSLAEGWQLAEGYASRKFSPVEVADSLLERIDRLDGTINAFYDVNAAAARSQAKEAEQRWLRGAPLSPLDGVPTSIKDALPSRGDLSYRGSAAHPERIEPARYDAPVVARMREAGMVFLGKTTMPDFGILPGSLSSKHGMTRNPWHLERSAGGSSSGAAASVAAGMNPVAIGTDIVGSIRLPAAFCGLFGMKPSQGRVPYYFPNSPSLVAGPMARSVRDAACLMNIVARPDTRDFTALPSQGVDYLEEIAKVPARKWRVAVVQQLGFGVSTDAEVLACFDQTVKCLAPWIEIVPVEADFSTEDLAYAELFYKARCRSEFGRYSLDIQRRASIISKWSESAAQASADDVFLAFNRLQIVRERTVRLMDDCDFMLLPSVPRPAFAANMAGYSERELFQPWINTFLFNLSEQPASSVPCGLTSDGLPIGLQIVGRRFDDSGVFQLSALLERQLRWGDTLARSIGSLEQRIRAHHGDDRKTHE